MSFFTRSVLGKLVAACVLSPAVVAIPANVAVAGAPFSEYGCNELWLERNGIYANKGYCFKTDRALSVFGPACFQPYGRLNAQEKRIVADIKYWERRKGCGAG